MFKRIAGRLQGSQQVQTTIDRTSILPLLWDRNDFLLQADGSVTIAWNLTNVLFFTIVTRSAGSVTAVADAQLRALDLGGPPGFQLAFENLHHWVGQIAWTQIQPGVFSSSVGDNFAASCIAIGELIVTAPVQGQPVFFIPNRSHLIVTTLGDERAMAAALEVAAAIHFERNQSLTVQPLVWSGGGFAPLRTQGDLHDRISGLLKGEVAFGYDAQAAKFQRAGGPMFQKIYVTQPPNMGPRSTVAWPFGFETFLPEADWIFFQRGDEPPFEVPWDAAAAILGLTEVQGMLPPRYRVSGMVTNDQLDVLRKAALEASERQERPG